MDGFGHGAKLCGNRRRIQQRQSHIDAEQSLGTPQFGRRRNHRIYSLLSAVSDDGQVRISPARRGMERQEIRICHKPRIRRNGVHEYDSAGQDAADFNPFSRRHYHFQRPGLGRVVKHRRRQVQIQQNGIFRRMTSLDSAFIHIFNEEVDFREG